jgi:hypothetical protein
MPSEEPDRIPFDRRFRQGMRTHRAAISIAVFAVGIFLCILAAGYFLPLGNAPPFSSINSYTATPTANYNLVFAIVGPIVFIIGAYLTGAYYVARRKFEHLMLTKSKAEFLRNIPDLEDLLWDLTPADEIRYERRKLELRIRR